MSTVHINDPTAAAIEAVFRGRWRVWLSDTGRWWAALADPLTTADLAAGCVPFLCSHHPDELTRLIHAQEDLHASTAPTSPSRHRPALPQPPPTDPREARLVSPWPHPPIPDELASLREEFSGFRIWREAHGERARYVAQRLHPGLHPHTVVTADPEELRAVLHQMDGFNGTY